nr:hypothetical protein [Tanacetum cinerariifolium]
MSNTLHNAIMEVGSKDRPSMLAPGNYVQWKSRIKRYIDTKPNHELIHYCLTNPPYKLGIDNDIYSTIDAFPNACEMWKAIERLKQGESINVQDLEINLYWEFGKFTSQDGESLESYYSRFYKMMNELIWNQCDVTNNQVNVQFFLQLQQEWQRFMTLVKQSQELKTDSYHKLYDILKQHQNEVNEIRTKRIARVANPLALVAQQQPVYHPQNHPTHYTQNSSTRSQQAATRNKEKAIVNSPQPIYDQEPSMVTEDDETSNDKEIDKLMALISLSFKKIYKPTNNNLRTSSNTSRENHDNSLRINRSAGYENQRISNVAGARETVSSTVVQKSRIQCYNCKEFGHVARECQKPKRAKDAAYHREKMLLCKQEEAGIQLNTEQADWRDDTDDDELGDQELEAHYMYMAQLQEVSPDAADSGPIFDAEPLQKVSNNDHYNVFTIESAHPEQSKSVPDTYPTEQDAHNVIIDSLDMSYDREEIIQNNDDNDVSIEKSNKNVIGSPITRTERFQETYKNVSQDIHDQLNAEAKAVQIILTGIDNDICSMVDACPNAYNETLKDKEIDKLMALISLSFKKIYKPTNNNLRTSSNTNRANLDNSLRINRSARYENQRICNVAGGRETSKLIGGMTLMMINWRDQELEAHYMYMAQLQEVSPDAADSGPIFDAEPLQKASNDDHYNVFAIESAHPEQSKSIPDTYPIEQDAHNMIIDSLDMSYDREEIDQNDYDNDVSLEKSNKNVIGSPITRTERFQETYKNVSQDKRDQLNAEAEVVQIILTGIDNDIYSTVDACSNACKMWKAIERLKQGESINVQDLETNLYWEFRKFTSQDGESLESYYLRSQQAATRNKGKAIVNSPQPIYDQEPSMVAEDDETSKEKEIDKLMALISLSFKKIYKPTNNNHRTSSNTNRANQDNSLRINRSARYENQRIHNVAGARETVSSTVVQKSGIQCYNCKEFRHVARECQKPKRAKGAAYHREKMLLSHYMYMAQLQEVSPDAADSGPIFDAEPLQKASNDDHNNVFSIESAHPEQSKSVPDTYPIEQDAHNVIIDSLDMSYDKEEIDQNDDDNDVSLEKSNKNVTGLRILSTY